MEAVLEKTPEGRYSMFEQACLNIGDVLWKEAGCTTELDYTEQTFWLLFRKHLVELNQSLLHLALSRTL